VTVVGHVSRSEVSTILARSRAAVVPSQWEETFGMVAVEAMATGTAPVASAHGAFPELVTHGSDGALFPPTDLDALVNILADVDDNPQRWDEYGRHGRQTYRSRFSPDVSVDRLREIYRFAMEHPIERSSRRAPLSGHWSGAST
jgi:glycosyltransferase involved in cell wall biosynthesis